MRHLPTAALLVSVALLGAACSDTGGNTSGATPPPGAGTSAASTASSGTTSGSAPSAGETSPRPPAPTDPASGAPSADPGSTAASDARPQVTGVLADGLDAPWSIAFLPDGDALVTERDSARIVLVGARGSVRRVGTVPGVDPAGEGGLLGIAVSPNFEQDRLVYVYFTGDDDNRVVRMRYSDDGSLGRPQVVVDGIDKATTHNGGRIAFGPDGFLYVATGDAQDGGDAQDRDSLNGKILRMTPEGDPAPGNPFDSLVWSLGHRNVQGLAWDSSGRLWASEFGQNTFDELNLIEAGRNYGWPEVEGEGGGEQFTDPQQVWSTDEASPSGIAVAGDAVYLAALRGQRLWQVPIDGRPTGEPRDYFSGEYGRLRAVALAPDGFLWLMTNNTDGRGDPGANDDRILRVRLR